MTVYRLQVLGQEGMYTYGDLAATPSLAKVAVGNLLRSTTDSKNRPMLLGIVSIDDQSGGNRRLVLVEAEEWPGQWTIGVPGTRKYSPGITRDTGNLCTAIASDPEDEVARMALKDALEETR